MSRVRKDRLAKRAILARKVQRETKATREMLDLRARKVRRGSRVRGVRLDLKDQREIQALLVQTVQTVTVRLLPSSTAFGI